MKSLNGWGGLGGGILLRASTFAGDATEVRASSWEVLFFLFFLFFTFSFFQIFFFSPPFRFCAFAPLPSLAPSCSLQLCIRHIGGGETAASCPSIVLHTPLRQPCLTWHAGLGTAKSHVTYDVADTTAPQVIVCPCPFPPCLCVPPCFFPPPVPCHLRLSLPLPLPLRMPLPLPLPLSPPLLSPQPHLPPPHLAFASAAASASATVSASASTLPLLLRPQRSHHHPSPTRIRTLISLTTLATLHLPSGSSLHKVNSGENL